MQPALVSIIIPCYNSQEWVAEAIESALSQSWPSTEVIVIDDGSTDGSLKVIEGFSDLVRTSSGPNRGACEARNQGIAMARGEWIQFLDSDDALTPNCVAEKMQLASRVDACPCSRIGPHRPEDADQLHDFWLLDHFDLKTILTKGAPQTAAPLHRKRDLLAVQGFRGGLPCAQEFDLHLRLSIQRNISFVSTKQVGVMIRAVSGSLSRSSGVRMVRTEASVVQNAWEVLRRDPKMAEMLAPLIAQRLIRSARWLYRHRERDEACLIAQTAKDISENWQSGNYPSRAEELLARLIGFGRFEFSKNLLNRGIRRLRRLSKRNALTAPATEPNAPGRRDGARPST